MTRLGLALFLVACSGAGPAAAPPVPTPAPAPGNVAAPAPDAAAPAATPPAEATVEAPVDAAVEEDETKILDLEAIGPLRFGSTGAELVKHLGPPRTKTPPGLEGAYGAYASGWSWPGVEAGMISSKPTGPWSARTIVVSAPRKLATKAGIRIGSSRQDVEARYKRGSMDQGSTESFLVGSPYGGMYFTFKDDVVTEIGIGVFAF